MMNAEALLALIADMYAQMAGQQARIDELEVELAAKPDENGKPATDYAKAS